MLDLTILHLNYMIEKALKEYPLLHELVEREASENQEKNIMQVIEVLSSTKYEKVNHITGLETFAGKEECKDLMFDLVKHYKENNKNQNATNEKIMIYDHMYGLGTYIKKVQLLAMKKYNEIKENFCFLQELQDYQLENSSFLNVNVNFLKQECVIELKDVRSTKNHDGFVDNGNLSIRFNNVTNIQSLGTIDLEGQKETTIFASNIKKEEDGEYTFELLSTYGTNYFLFQISFLEVDTCYQALKNSLREQCIRIRI